MMDEKKLIATLKLPWPPSTNALHRIGRKKMYNDPKYTLFKQIVKIAWMEQGRPKINEEKVDITFFLFPPDFRPYDTDNRSKSTQDAITGTGAWVDDKIVRNVLLIPCTPINENGAVVVKIYQHEDYNIYPEKYGYTRKKEKKKKCQRKP